MLAVHCTPVLCTTPTYTPHVHILPHTVYPYPVIANGDIHVCD